MCRSCEVDFDLMANVYKDWVIGCAKRAAAEESRMVLLGRAQGRAKSGQGAARRIYSGTASGQNITSLSQNLQYWFSTCKKNITRQRSHFLADQLFCSQESCEMASTCFQLTFRCNLKKVRVRSAR